MIANKEYGERVQFVVEDVNVGKPEIVGTTSFVGIPVEALRSGSWKVLGFDAVVEIELTLQPMEKALERAPLAEEVAPPSVDDDGDDDGDAKPAEASPEPAPEATNTDANGWSIEE